MDWCPNGTKEIDDKRHKSNLTKIWNPENKEDDTNEESKSEKNNELNFRQDHRILAKSLKDKDQISKRCWQ
jgi:hypothetical protein